MHSSLKFVIVTIIAITLFALSFDIASIRQLKKDVKDSLDLSTKAAALQIDEESTKIGEGIFEIDTTKGKTVNEEIFKENMREKLSDYTIETEIINVHMPYIFTDSKGNEYSINEPTVFSSVTFTYSGVFIKQDFIVNILSGSTLVNKNEL